MCRALFLLPFGLIGTLAAQQPRRCDYHDPKWSPTGDLIAFYSNRDGDFDVYTIRADGGDLRRLTNHPGRDGGPSWAPDGRSLVFVSDSISRGTLHFMDRLGAPIPDRPPCA